MSQITEANSVDEVVRILEKADRFYGKHRIIPLSQLFNPKDEDKGLFKSKLSSLKEIALEHAVNLILEQKGFMAPLESIEAMKDTLDSTASSISTDLWTNNALASSLATSAIDDTHEMLKEFCQDAKDWPSEIYKIAPELSQISNPHSDSKISKDSFWDMFGFNIESRSEIQENFENLSSTLAEKIEQIYCYAEKTISEDYPQAASVLFGTVIKEQPSVSASNQGPLIS